MKCVLRCSSAMCNNGCAKLPEYLVRYAPSCSICMKLYLQSAAVQPVQLKHNIFNSVQYHDFFL